MHNLIDLRTARSSVAFDSAGTTFGSGLLLLPKMMVLVGEATLEIYSR